MESMILPKGISIVIAEICEELYNEKGVGAVIDYANKIGLNYSYCEPCEEMMPEIENTELCICAVCGTRK